MPACYVDGSVASVGRLCAVAGDRHGRSCGQGVHGRVMDNMETEMETVTVTETETDVEMRSVMCAFVEARDTAGGGCHRSHQD